MTSGPSAFQNSRLTNGHTSPAKRHDYQTTDVFEDEQSVEQENDSDPRISEEQAARVSPDAAAAVETEADQEAEPESEPEPEPKPEVEEVSDEIEATPSVEEPDLPNIVITAPVDVPVSEEGPETKELMEVLEGYRKRVKILMRANQASRELLKFS